MLQSYLRHWGLGGQPFSLSPDPNMLYLSRQHKECLVRLKYAFYSNKGGALLISESAGEGKTSVVHRLVGDLREELGQGLQVVLVDHPSLTPNQMVQEICTQLGVQNPSANRYRNLNQLKEALLRLDGGGMRTLVIVDEGQLLKGRLDTLQELRILLNFVLEGRFLLSFMLVGQKELEDTIRGIPEFWQRLPVRFFLGSLDRKDSEAMVRFRLGRCGRDDRVFTDDGYDSLYRYSGGCPRQICVLADLCLLIGYSLRREQLDYTIVQSAHSDMVRSDQGFHYYQFLRAEGAGSECDGSPPLQDDRAAAEVPSHEPESAADAGLTERSVS